MNETGKRGVELSGNLGLKIKQMREANSWSQNELGLRSSLSPSYINRLEKNVKRNTSIYVLQKLANAFKVSMSELLELEENSSPKSDLVDILIGSNFKIEGIKTGIEMKGSLIELFKFVVQSEWKDSKSRNKEMPRLLELMDEFKELQRKEEGDTHG
jgi:transcriptional regulator with XRE-family HTH domain